VLYYELLISKLLRYETCKHRNESDRFTSATLILILAGRGTNELDSGAQQLRRSHIDGYGPRPQARARLAHVEVGQRAGIRADRRPLRSPALVARADFLKSGHFAPFSQFLHTNGLNFPDVFYLFTSTYDPYKP